MGLRSGREKKKWDDKKRVENREGSLGYPGFVKPVFTKAGKPLGKRKRSLGHLGSVKPVLTRRRLKRPLVGRDVLRYGPTGPGPRPQWGPHLVLDSALIRSRFE
ncbi:hypothetical protein TNCV_2392791 [Trichonephila clavipes]|nr:hypothetical protein TNCV_2392791 [Trichonephila clavipes]